MSPRQILSLSSKEKRVVQMMRDGCRLLPIRYSRNYGLFHPSSLAMPIETVRRMVVENLVSRGIIAIGVVESVSEYVVSTVAKPQGE